MQLGLISHLEFIEAFAEAHDLISSEEMLSEMFDNEVMPTILEQHAEPGVTFEDTDMVNEEFSNWADALCKDGTIHLEQYSIYEYVGEWY